MAAIYLSESGGEPRIKARTDMIDIYRNDIEDNWSGITLWENADRFCNSPANTSTEICTLLVSTVSSAGRRAIDRPPLLDDCRWKTQRVAIHDNRFAFDQAAITGCEVFLRTNGSDLELWHRPALVTLQGRRESAGDHLRPAEHLVPQHLLGPWSFTTSTRRGG